mgnify:CR=1 FL=1
MENKKDKAMVVVISGLTSNQAGQLTKEFTKAKDKYAPKARGTIARGSKENVGNMIKGGFAKKITKKSWLLVCIWYKSAIWLRR